MERTRIHTLARVLKVLVTITFVCNLLALPLTPFLTKHRFQIDLDQLVSVFQYDFDDGLGNLFGSPLYTMSTHPYIAMMALFLFFCGVCTAVILWQGRRVLDTILRGTPFCGENAGNLRRAAVCCFCIAAAALVRVAWGVWYFQSIRPVLTYCGLFVPIFFMGGLLFLVMSALFRQAASLKEENDLTI